MECELLLNASPGSPIYSSIYPWPTRRRCCGLALGTTLTDSRFHDMQVLTSSVGVVSSECDPGVVIDSDSRLTMADRVVSVRCSAYLYRLRQI